MSGGVRRIKIDLSDIVVIVLYFGLSLSVGIWSICRPTRKSVKGFFLAGRSMNWLPVGLSMFASNIGSEHFIGLAGTGAVSGIAVILFEWSAVVLLLLLAWLFLPVYISSGIYTMPEFLARRFGGQRLRIYLSAVALFTYLVANVSVDLYSGALFVQQALGWNIFAGVFILLAITSVYTIFGGLSTVILTDAIAVFIMVIGGAVLTIIGFVRVGGYNNLQYLYSRSVPDTVFNNTNSSCGFPREDAFHIFRDPVKSDYPWPGTLMRTFVGGLWYWCSNQLIVQRGLAAKNLSHAKAGSVLAGYLKIIPLFIMVMPGMISRVLFPNEVACADQNVCKQVCGNPSGCSNIAYPKIVVELLPSGARGLILAVMMAAVVSSLTSLFNSASTIFTLDIWRKLRPRCSDVELLIAGRLFVLILVGLSILWIPIMQQQEGGQIFKYATTAAGYISAPTAALFILGMFWSRCNEKGAFWGMLIATAIGLVRFVLDFVHPAPLCGQPDNRPAFVSKFHGYYYFTMQVGIAFVLAVVISLLTKPIPKYKLDGVTFWTRYKKPYYEKESESVPMETINDDDYNVHNNREKHETHVTNGKEITSTTALTDMEPIVEKPSVFRRVFEVVCGISKPSKGEEEATEIPEDHDARVACLREKPFLRNILNANAIAIVGVLIFLLGFFN